MGTEHRRPEEAYRLAEQDIRTLFEELPLNVFFKDTGGRYLMTSHLCEMLSGGNESYSIRGKTDVEVQQDPELGRRFLEEDLEIVRTGKEMRYLQEMVLSGETYHYEIYKKPLRNSDGEIFGILGTVTDLTELIRTQQELEQLSITDPMTGTYNRSFLTDRRDEITRRRYPMAVIIADGNDLKKINDRYGHACGDKIILSMVENLRRYMREEDLLVRLGGDEFLLFCPGMDDEDCRTLLRRIRASEHEYTFANARLSAAYGYAIMQDADCSIDDAINRADRVMYSQKQKGSAGAGL